MLLLLAAATLAQAAEDPIRKALNALQPAGRREPQYVVYDRRPDRKPQTIFATIESELVAYRVAADGTLKRLTAYGNDAYQIELLDVTGDGRPEVLLTLSPGNRSAPVEVVRWGGRFTKIGETNDHALFVDLDHDGKLEIVEPSEESVSVSRLRGGSYKEMEWPALVDVIVRTKYEEGPETTIAPIVLPAEASRRCHLRVVNGQRGGRDRVSALELRLASGKRIPLRVTKNDEFVDTIVTLPSHDTSVNVTLTGPSGATVVLIVESIR